jgi:death-on-curing protein
VTIYLSLDDMLTLIRGVNPQAQVLDYGLLESAIARPQASVFGADAYPTVFEKAAALLHSIARNHALSDGNKRCAWVASQVFLELNGVATRAVDIDAAEKFVLSVATGAVDDIPTIATTLESYTT